MNYLKMPQCNVDRRLVTRWLCLLLSIYLHLWTQSSVFAQGDPTLAGKTPERVKAILDMAALDFGRIIPDAVSPWVVAQVTPDVLSGGLSPAEDFKSADAGKPVPVPNDASPVWTMIKGEIKIDEVLSGTLGKKPSSYIWASPSLIADSNFYRDPDWPFMGSSGMVICPVNDGELGSRRFSPAYLMPPEWESFVKPAVAFYRSNAALLRPPPVQGQALPHERQQKVERLLTDKNPFIAVAAWRLLIVSGGLDAAIARQELAQSRGMTQALFTYLLLTRLTAAEHAPYTQALLDMVNAAHTSSQLLGISIGVFASVQSETASVSEALDPLLQALDSKQKALATDTAADRQLIDILVKCGVRQPEGRAH